MTRLESGGMVLTADDVPGGTREHELLAGPVVAGSTDRVRLVVTDAGPLDGDPVLLLHGLDDGLVPEWSSSAAYAAYARRHGARLAYWRLRRAQHFDAFLGQPALATRYLPLLPYAHAALDALWAHLHEGAPLPQDREIRPTPRATTADGVAPLRREDLGLAE